MKDVIFLNPAMLTLLVIVPLLVYFVIKFKHRTSYLLIPDISQITSAKASKLNRYIPLVLKLLSVAILVVAIARPVKTEIVKEIIPRKQAAIMLAIDVSKSMLAEDLTPNRLLALKKIAAEFIDSRPNDLIGLTIYAGESFTKCPLTTNHKLLKSLLHESNDDWLPDKTAIGYGLATSVNRLSNSYTEKKIIILLTDGENNTGTISPEKATELAKQQQIKVYTIGIGTNGYAPYPSFKNEGEKIEVPVSIDERLLKEIAVKTGGEYFRATNNEELTKIYSQIDTLETTREEVKEHQVQRDIYPFLLMLSLILLTTAQVLKYSALKNFTP